MSSIPISYRKIIEPLIETARTILESGENLVSVAFVGNLTTEEIYTVGVNVSSNAAKDRSAALLSELAALHQADFVFAIMDAWSLQPDKAHRVEEIIERYGSIGASPYRVDVVSFTLETRYGIWLAQSSVKPKGVSKKKRTFAPPAFQFFSEVQGRFVNLLPVKESPEQMPGGLH